MLLAIDTAPSLGLCFLPHYDLTSIHTSLAPTLNFCNLKYHIADASQASQARVPRVACASCGSVALHASCRMRGDRKLLSSVCIAEAESFVRGWATEQQSTSDHVIKVTQYAEPVKVFKWQRIFHVRPCFANFTIAEWKFMCLPIIQTEISVLTLVPRGRQVELALRKFDS